MTNRDRDTYELYQQLTHQLVRTIDDFVETEPDADDPKVVFTAILSALRCYLQDETCLGCRKLQRELCSEVFAMAVDEAMKAPTEYGDHHLN
jgi:hypothetical protein